MAEWTVQNIRRYLGEEYYFKKKYFILVDDETWDIYELSNKDVVCRINSLIDENGSIVATIGRNYIAPCRNLTGHFSLERKPTSKSELKTPTGRTIVPEVDFNKAMNTKDYGQINALFFPDDLVKTYGLKTELFIDLVMLGIALQGDVTGEKMKERIYSQRYVRGKITINPSGITTSLSPASSEPLVQQSIGEKFYEDLIEDINRSYGYDILRATTVLIRTLFENLIITLLRKKYGTKDVDIYFDKNHGHLHDFVVLLRNLKDRRADFNAITTGFDDAFFIFLDKYREQGNKVHALEVFMDKKTLEGDKKQLNHYITVLANAIQTLR